MFIMDVYSSFEGMLMVKTRVLRILRNLGLGFISNLVLDQIFRFLVFQSSPGIKYKQCSKFHQFPMDIFGVMKVFGISLQSAEVPELSPEVPDIVRKFRRNLRKFRTFAGLFHFLFISHLMRSYSVLI